MWKELGKSIRSFRYKAMISQKTLACKIGCKQPLISKYEAGSLIPDLPQLKKICDVLGISLVDFVKKFEDNIVKSREKTLISKSNLIFEDYEYNHRNISIGKTSMNYMIH